VNGVFKDPLGLSLKAAKNKGPIVHTSVIPNAKMVASVAVEFERFGEKGLEEEGKERSAREIERLGLRNEGLVRSIGNVAGDSTKCRGLVLAHGALIPLLAHVNEHAKLSILRNATSTLSKFSWEKTQPPCEQPTLPALERLIHSSDEEVLTDASWALSYKDSYLSDGTNDKIQDGVCPRFVELLLYYWPNGPFIHLLQTAEFDIKKEAAWALSNATSGGDPNQIKYMVVMLI
ncbi:hypothetical protein IFM89_034374, partial [Coptis chinensis]